MRSRAWWGFGHVELVLELNVAREALDVDDEDPSEPGLEIILCLVAGRREQLRLPRGPLG